jgi:hypothetical protein
MSYREENNQVVLTMSREDYELLLMVMGSAFGVAKKFDGNLGLITADRVLGLTNRLNQGNPNYRPYEVAEKK